MSARGRDGFTLVEIVIVVLVIAMLAALAQPNLQRAMLKARATEAIGHLQVIRVAVLNYHATHHVYPGDVNAGLVPTGLAPYLPPEFSFTTEHYVVDYDDWSQNPNGFVGLTVVTADQLLGIEIVSILGSHAWTNWTGRFTWVIEWN